MSRDDTEFLNRDGMAFDYVTGVMRGEERKRFEAALHQLPPLQEQVQFWEEQLINLSDTAWAHNPHAKTWPGIEQKIRQSLASTTTGPSRWITWLTLGMPSVITAIIVSCLFIFLPQPKQQLSTDYVAVLTDIEGEPLLTSLTETSNNVMWLKWERMAITQNKNLQLWAISKRDGQTRSIAVFAQTSSGQMHLSTASLRLVKEAASLVLTEEDVGGSALDEPSAIVLAKGACVLLTPEPETITPTSKTI